MSRGGADHAVEHTADKAAKRAVRQCRLHGRSVGYRRSERSSRSRPAQAQEWRGSNRQPARRYQDHWSRMLHMTPTEDLQLDAGQHAKAIARWEDEGGASNSKPSKVSAERSIERPAAAGFEPPRG